jgi:outer membrane lipoprotein SlyB
MRSRIDVLLAVAAALVLAAPALAQPPADACDACGVVTSIALSIERQQWTPLGTTGVNTVTASGRATDATTQFSIGPQLKNQGLVVVGAAGGATYGKRPNAYEKPRWDVTVKMDRGGTRVIPQSYEPMLREGDRVRVLGTQLDLLNP